MRHHLPPQQAALPMHLMLAMLPWIASSAALRQLSSASTPWKSATPPLERSAAARLESLWEKLLSDTKLAQAVERESRHRATEFLQGVMRYQQTPYEREPEEFNTVFSCGGVRLLAWGERTSSAAAVLLVPSLINRYYVLDLTRKLSLARYLHEQGLRVYVVDWGNPTRAEQYFDTALYVSERLIPMVEWMRGAGASSLTVAGYCMGGLLALALATSRPDLVDRLACFATPWDFSVPEFPKTALCETDVQQLEAYIMAGDNVSAETIHTLFHLANPFAYQNKLREFVHMKGESQKTSDFLAVERWANDGVPMTRGVAKDCLIDWAYRNSTARLQWRVCGRKVNPETIGCPAFIAAPAGDKIVPSASSLPLARLFRNATVVQPDAGHVGMIVGNNHKAALWEPFTQWVACQSA